MSMPITRIFAPVVLAVLMFCMVAALNASGAQHLQLSWSNNMLRVSGPNLPGEYVETWYLEAFCRSGSTTQEWHKTTIPHQTELVSSAPDGSALKLRTTVQEGVVIDHEIRSSADEIDFRLVARNDGSEFQDVQWFQPCMRVDRFTGKGQQDYIERSFIFTSEGLKMLNDLPRAEEAIYKGGQVYVPRGVPMNDVNPRPISTVRPANNLIGCFSADGTQLLATAWAPTQELFQGVIVCLHNDPRIGGLEPGERKTLRGRLYILPNDPGLLLRRYKEDFPE